MKKPILTKLHNADDKYKLKMPGFSRVFFINTEELKALKETIEKEIDQ